MRGKSQFKSLALPHLAAIYRLARQLGGPDRADDLVQETYLNAWKHFGQFEPSTNCRAWLCRILRNTWISQWRKTRLELPVGDLEELSAEPTYASDPLGTDGELSADMQWALDQLPETHRWAVVLADVEELTYQEIAVTMGCPVGTVMSRISRGRRLLARLLRDRMRTERPSIRIVGRER